MPKASVSLVSFDDSGRAPRDGDPDHPGVPDTRLRNVRARPRISRSSTVRTPTEKRAANEGSYLFHRERSMLRGETGALNGQTLGHTAVSCPALKSPRGEVRWPGLDVGMRLDNKVYIC
jgi:hypothetical protein